VQNAAATQLKVIVPKGAGTGVVTVQRSSQTATGPSFNYILSAQVSTLAGSDDGFADGTGVAAKFYFPVGIVCDAQGNVYVGDASNHRIRKVTSTGVVTTFAGGAMGFVEGTGGNARFNTPVGVCIDAQGNLYAGDIGNYAVRKISPGAVVSNLAGGNEGYFNGQGVAAQFDMPIGVCSDALGNIYVADNKNHCIRKISPTGLVSTLAGGTEGNADGTGTAAQFEEPYGLCSDATGNIYVVDNSSSRVRKVTPAGVVTTIAGSTAGMQDGNASVAKFNQPNGICVDPQGNLFVTDYHNNRIRKITPAGIVSTYAGSGGQGFQDGLGTTAYFNRPGHICIDAQGTLFVADRYNHRIRKIVVE
jgi:sugar lactone lactonase YvrE